MKKLIILSAILLAGCSSNRVQLQPKLGNEQTVSYDRGSIKMSSQSSLESDLTVLAYSADKMVVSLSVVNATNEPILLSEKSLAVELLSGGRSQAGAVYSYDELAEEAAAEGYDTAAQVGSTVAGIGASFIPFGNIAYSVGRLFYSIGSQQSSETHEERVDKLAFSQLNKNYLRQQTIAPGERYSGALKIAFDDNLGVGDTVVFSLSAGNGLEKFSFVCEQSKDN